MNKVKTLQFEQDVEITFRGELLKLGEAPGFYTYTSGSKRNESYIVYYHVSTYSFIISFDDDAGESFVEKISFPLGIDECSVNLFQEEISKYFHMNWKKVCEELMKRKEEIRISEEDLLKVFKGVEILQKKNEEDYWKLLSQWEN